MCLGSLGNRESSESLDARVDLGSSENRHTAAPLRRLVMLTTCVLIHCPWALLRAEIANPLVAFAVCTSPRDPISLRSPFGADRAPNTAFGGKVGFLVDGLTDLQKSEQAG